ncbi:hypothetical protein Pla175_47610 [Pirellulimonas nuda]|uniref:Cytochrome c domain-containing protein n=1 Tax=Pirellulimonas nuda TaxID=2528009 RepID=A0A518DIN6_9BACT|nr:hypothetical protein [Pirellulimonas nuda]QDU91340.1 hypothetical protein Pla175_47610 [Pirellulimonas nuda]
MTGSTPTDRRVGPAARPKAGPVWLACAVLAACGWGGSARAQVELDRAPIFYDTTPTNDPVALLQAQLDAGERELRYEPEHGYLRSALEALGVRDSSQVLVNSKTSFQLQKISPRRPRALYFDDRTHVGWVQGGDVIEVMATDPVQGEVFYTLAQKQRLRPRFVRDRGQCIICHASSRTQGVPGGLVRSVFVDAGGQPRYGSGTFNVDHRSPFSQRWGGWYVTGTHGAMRHMGNVVAADPDRPDELDREAGANVTDLAGRVDTAPYLTPHSDIVALMVLEHQTQMQNHITFAGYDCRSATHYDGVMSEALERPADYVSESTLRRAASAGDRLLRYLLFADEFPLEAPVEGTSSFAEDFQARGPRDSKGRSLRDLDLRTRMFRHPCSYLIYSPSFDALPPLVRGYVVDRLHDVLTGKDPGGEFAHLTPDDRRAILEILAETKPDLWGTPPGDRAALGSRVGRYPNLEKR